MDHLQHLQTCYQLDTNHPNRAHFELIILTRHYGRTKLPRKQCLFKFEIAVQNQTTPFPNFPTKRQLLFQQQLPPEIIIFRRKSPSLSTALDFRSLASNGRHSRAWRHWSLIKTAGKPEMTKGDSEGTS